LHSLELVNIWMLDLPIAGKLPRQSYVRRQLVGRSESAEDHVVLRFRVPGVCDRQSGVAVSWKHRHLGHVRRCTAAITMSLSVNQQLHVISIYFSCITHTVHRIDFVIQLQRNVLHLQRGALWGYEGHLNAYLCLKDIHCTPLLYITVDFLHRPLINSISRVARDSIQLTGLTCDSWSSTDTASDTDAKSASYEENVRSVPVRTNLIHACVPYESEERITGRKVRK